MNGSFRVFLLMSFVTFLRALIVDLTYMDYTLSFLDGLRSDTYVPGSLLCALDTKYTWLQVEEMIIYLSNGEDKRYEAITFNITGTLSGSLPDAIYHCYAIPTDTNIMWQIHYQEFVDSTDFQMSFIQNLLGQILTFADIYDKSKEAGIHGDFLIVAYQLGRFFRKILDFGSMERGSLTDIYEDFVGYWGGYNYLEQDKHALTDFEITIIDTLVFDTSYPVIITINIVSGIISGGFNAPNSSFCKDALLNASSEITDFVTASAEEDLDGQMYHSTNTLRLLHNNTYHCYYTALETIATVEELLEFQDARDILYNFIYKTGDIFDKIREMWIVYQSGIVEGNDYFILAQGVSAIVYLLILPRTPEI